MGGLQSAAENTLFRQALLHRRDRDPSVRKRRIARARSQAASESSPESGELFLRQRDGEHRPGRHNPASTGREWR